MAENLFYFGDAYQALERLAAENRRVQLCAIDPPYRTGRNFGAYDDRASSDDYYAMMRQVLQGIYDVLDDAGSLFVHIDERTHARLRLMLDDIFGERNFRNEIVWAYRSGGRATSHFSRKHDIIACPISAPAESDLPNVGLVELRDPETGEVQLVDTSSKQIREAFQTAARADSSRLAQTFQAARIDVLPLSTERPYLDDVRALFVKRRARRR